MRLSDLKATEIDTPPSLKKNTSEFTQTLATSTGTNHSVMIAEGYAPNDGLKGRCLALTGEWELRRHRGVHILIPA